MEGGFYHFDFLLNKIFRQYFMIDIDFPEEESQIDLVDFFSNCLSLDIFLTLISIFVLIFEIMF